jgi:DNA-directed RNA polymerase subunit RPC12/RpoP
MAKQNKKVVCKYCGGKVPRNYYTGDLCGNCYHKLPLVKKLLKMVKSV